MTNATTYSDEGEIGEVRFVDDFLPPPDQLVLRDEGVKVTLTLSRRSVAFFKAEARRHDVPYQRMIRALLDIYAERHGQRAAITSLRTVEKRR